MIMLANGVFSSLSLRNRKNVYELQEHILVQERNRRDKWPKANELIKTIAREISLSLSDGSLPVELDRVFELLNIRLKTEPTQLSKTAGKLIPTEGGFKMTIFGQLERSSGKLKDFPLFNYMVPKNDNADTCNALSPRGRFSFAHELGHVFFYVSDSQTSKPKRLLLTNAGRTGRRWRIEGLCHDFARTLLMPDKHKELVGEFATIPELIKTIKTFNITAEPAVRRILYDWEKWPLSLLAKVEIQRDNLKIKCFRGKHRKKSSYESPKSSDLSRLLDGINGPLKICDRLIETFKLKKENVKSNKSVIWAIL